MSLPEPPQGRFGPDEETALTPKEGALLRRAEAALTAPKPNVPAALGIIRGVIADKEGDG